MLKNCNVFAGSIKGDDGKLRLGLPPLTTILYHFGTSGISVALATAATHPLGYSLSSSFVL